MASSSKSGNIPLEQLERKALSEQQKRIKPGECLKYLKTIIDPAVLNSIYGTQILSYLQTLGVTAEVRSQDVAGTVSWQRTLDLNLIERNGDLDLNDSIVTEDSVLLVYQASHFIDAAVKDKLLQLIQSTQIKLPAKRITLIVCGLKEYFRTNSQATKACGRFELETKLTKLQLFANVNHRLIETAADLANTVMQFTKSVAETPYKNQIAEKMLDTKFYVTNDNKDCVAVKGTAGLSKLWQHHLIKLPLVTLETAEAIINEYPMPRLLLNAYEKSNNGPELLANIPVRRAGGPLTSVRKVGPELSRKVHALYTNKDPKYLL